MRIVVTGLIGSIPIAGLTFHYLQYMLGLRKLGHEVLYLEDTGTWYYDPYTDSMSGESAKSVQYLATTMERHGFSEQWTLVAHDGVEHGVAGRRFIDFLDSADLLLNVTGAGIIREKYRMIPVRAYVDTDPAFIQFRIASGNSKDLAHLDAHTALFSFGVNIGDDNCSIPTSGLKWLPTVQPIDFSLWPDATVPPPNAPFTTIMKWKTYDPVVFEGRQYGLKDGEMARFVGLAQRCPVPLEIAFAGEMPADLVENGWLIRPAIEVSDTLDAYRDYILSSAGEWSVAKHAYVATNSGWFSERSACYMACGRPVIVQETGFSRWLRADFGVLPFRTLDEAATALEAVTTHPEPHRKAAREVAFEYFSAEMVLATLIDDAFHQ
ncbi:MAG TPA: hypothetical protein VMO47_02965 [Rhodothermales bacterium]|nr:hypothetical protein [Rhodothermales bacterium]